MRISAARLDRMIAEAIVDCYNESEQLTGLFTMMEENLIVPFTAIMLGVEVAVERIELNDDREITAVCRRGRERQRVPILDLALPDERPKGSEWIEAYRRWARGK